MKIKKKIKKFIRQKLKNEFFENEIIEKVFHKIKREYGEKLMIFEPPALSLIADDSDYHRTRRGYMKYESIAFCKIEGSWFVLGQGEAWGSYPADPYSVDILAVPISSGEIKKQEMKKVIERRINAFFKFSIIASKRSGAMFIGKYWEKKIKISKERFSSFIQEASERANDLFTIEEYDMVPILVSPSKYKKELALYLFQKIEEALTL